MTRDAASTTSLRALLDRQPVLPVVTLGDARPAVPLAEALVAGGLPAIEVTLRTDAALAALTAMRGVTGARVGAGTLRTAGDVDAAVAAGAAFGVAPGATPALLDAAEAAGLPFMPGAQTPSEVMALAARGYDLLKFFPAAAGGGPAALRALAGPFPGIAFCPTGGVTPADAPDYLALANVACVGGSWLTPPAALARGDWTAIRAAAARAAALTTREAT